MNRRGTHKTKFQTGISASISDGAGGEVRMNTVPPDAIYHFGSFGSATSREMTNLGLDLTRHWVGIDVDQGTPVEIGNVILVGETDSPTGATWALVVDKITYGPDGSPRLLAYEDQIGTGVKSFG